jgi:hypothetical protein
MAELLSARKAREERDVIVDLEDGTYVRARREDMALLMFEGRIPMPMLVAVQRMIEMPHASAMERVLSLGEDNSRTLLDVLRRHVCNVVLEPFLVMTDDGDPDHLPVDYFDIPKLMLIWNATAVLPRVTPVEAATFRGRARPDVTPAPPNSAHVPAAPQQLDRPDVELVTR